MKSYKMCKEVNTAPGIPQLHTNEDLLQGNATSDACNEQHRSSDERNQVCFSILSFLGSHHVQDTLK